MKAQNRVQILTCEEARSSGWDEMVADHPLGSVYHHTAFGETIAATFGHAHPCYFALSDQSGRCHGGIVLFLIRSWLTGTRLVSIPWACYGDPLVRSPEEFGVLFREIKAFADRERASYVEIRTCEAAALLRAADFMVPVDHDRVHLIDLSGGLDAAWSRFHKTRVRERIHRAERSGISVRRAGCVEDVVSFHRLFAQHRRRLGLPPQKPEYFQNLWRYMTPSGMAHFWLASAREQLVGGLCCLQFKQRITLSYIGVDEAYRPYGVGQCLFWASFRDAMQRGIKTADLGKTPAGSDGLLCYKRAWGAQEIEAPVFYYPRPMGVSSHQDESKFSHKAVRLFWWAAPSVVSKVAAKFFYRHTG